MKELICKIFNHNWKYCFSPSNAFHKRNDIRICKCCGKIQNWMTIPLLPESEDVWMNMIEYTKEGAKKHISHLITK